MRIGYACEADHSGIAVAARRAVGALVAAGADVQWIPLRSSWVGHTDEGTLEIPPFMRSIVSDGSPPDVLVLHAPPQQWSTLLGELWAPRVVGHTVWEADVLPRPWLRQLRLAEELWVPCAWNASVFAEAGFPAHVIPHVIDQTAPETVALELPAEHTVFLTVTAWDRRKGPDLTLEAFQRAFSADDPVTLVVKTAPLVAAWPTGTPVEEATWWQVMQVIRRHRNPANVVLVTDHYRDAQMAGLIARADCFVSLTRAEGWGLGAFDAATRGIPVVITGHGGQLEYLGTRYPGLVPYTLVGAEHPNRLFDDRMKWAEPDLDAAVELLRAVVRDGHLREQAQALAPLLRERFAPERVGQAMVRALG